MRWWPTCARVPAVRNEVPPPVYKNEHVTHITLIPGAEKPFSDADLNDKLKRGFYLATIAHCMECHSRRPDGTQDYVNWQGKGGFIFRGPFGQVPARNISSHREKGIGAWTDAEIKQALTKGYRPVGRSFHLPMARQIYFAKMTEPISTRSSPGCAPSRRSNDSLMTAAGVACRAAPALAPLSVRRGNAISPPMMTVATIALRRRRTLAVRARDL